MEIIIAIIYIVLIGATVVMRRSLKLREYLKSRNPNVRSTVRISTEFNRHS